MTASNCMRGKVRAGRVAREPGERLAGLFDALEARLRHDNGPRPGETAATLAERIAAHDFRTKRRARLQSLKAQLGLWTRIQDAVAKGQDPEEAALAALDFDPTRSHHGFNVAKLADAVRSQALAQMADVVDAFGSKAAGLDILAPGVRRRKKAGQRDLRRELHGEDSGNPAAKEMARGARQATEFLRRLFNASGGNIGELKGWAPQGHSRRAVNAVTQEEWVAFVLERLDRSRMIDPDTDLPFTDTKLRRVLGQVYRDIATDGLADIEPGGFPSRSIANRRAARRFLIFKDAAAQEAYNDAFGEGDLFEQLLGHVNGIARDIAVMRVLGPNPETGLRFLETAVGRAQGRAALEKTGKRGARAAARIGQGRPKLRALYAAVSGELYGPANQFWANVNAANRNVVTSAMLGGALWSAIADRSFSFVTERLNGIPAGRTLGAHLKLWSPAGRADRKLAARAGFVNELALGTAIGAHRYFGEVIGPGWSRSLADISLRLSGLSPWTQWGRTAFSMEFLGHVTDHLGKSFDQVDGPLKRALVAYGIGPDDWEIYRATPLFKDAATGAEILRFQDIIGRIEEAGPLFDRHFDAAARLQQMILTEQDFAIPTVSKRAVALLTGGQRPGTFWGEVARNTTLFKAFPVTVVLTHLRRAAVGNVTGQDRAMYAATFLIGLTVMGTLGEQLSQISKGRDPLPLSDRRTWLKGAARAGGLGIFGDFIFASENRFGRSLPETLAGPVLGSQIPQALQLTAGNLLEAFREGEPRGVGRELTRFLRLNTPLRSLWYMTLVFDRMIFDEIQRQVDPDHAASFRRQQARARREFNQRFFSPPGSGLPPPRGPALERAFQ